MPRLIVAHPHFTYPGGASVVALETARGLARRGFEVHIISLRHQPALVAPFSELHFHELGGPLSAELGYWLRLPAVHLRFMLLADALQPDAILAHVFPANYWAFTYRMVRPRVPCIWYCHEPSAFVHDRHVIGGVSWPMKAGVLAANPLLQIVDRLLVRYADQIVANSLYTANRVRQIYWRGASIASPGIEASRFNPHRPKERMVLAVGRLTHFKRFDLLIHAAAILREQGYYDVRWIIAGDGEDATTLRSLATRLGVQDMITFTGRIDEATLVDYFERALIVAVTATAEPFGIVPVEAMAAGAAVVCSANGGPATTIQHNVTGLHFRPNDHYDLARQIARLLNEPQFAIQLGRNGCELVNGKYSWAWTTDGIVDALRETQQKVFKTQVTSGEIR